MDVQRPAFSLLILCFFTFFLGLGRQAITDSDEGYYAEASREMVESGDWLTPRLNGIKYFEKPPLQYWVTAAAFRAFGISEGTARLWPVLSTFLAVLFLGAFLHFDPSIPVALLFIVAMFLFVLGLVYFLREIFLATARLKIGLR